MSTMDWIAQGVLLLLVNAAWQVALVGAVLWGVLRLGRVRSPQWRYGLCVATLSAIVICPVLTAAAPHVGLQVVGLQWRLDAAADTQRVPAQVPDSPPVIPAESMREPAGATVAAHTPVQDVERTPPAPLAVTGPLARPSMPYGEAGSQPEAAAVVGSAAEPAQANDRRATPGWLVLAYSLGVSLMLARLAVGQVRVGRLRATARRVDSSVLAMLDRLRARTGVITAVGVRASDRISGPVLVGVLRPTVLIPSAMIERSGDDLEAIILHELAHVHRRDALVNLFERLTVAVLFFHPVIWLLSRELRRQRELCCDAWVIAHTGREYEYARCLTDLAQRLRTVSRPVPSLAMAELRHELPQRIAAVLDGSARAARSLPIGGFAAVMGVALSLAVLISACGITAGVDRRDDGGADASAEASSDHDAIMSEEESPSELKVAARPGELTGIVVDAEGEPLEGVLVDVWTWHAGDETRTDKSGRFRLGPFQDQETVEVRFSKQGYSPEHIGRQPLGIPDAVFTLDNKTYFEGRVLAPDGKPVANALIRADQGPVRAEGVVVSTVWTEVRSDDQGRYRMYVDGDPDTYDIQVKVDGVGVARLPDVEVNKGKATALDIHLKKGVTFRAKIIDSETKEPVAGIRLYHWEHPGVEGRSNADGMVEIEGMTPGKFDFEVDAPSYARWWSEECTSDWARFKIDEERGGAQRNFDDLPFELDFGMDPVTIVVERAVTIRGKVLDPDGKPVAGATVAPARTGSANSITGDTRYSFRTNDEGAFEMHLPASKRCEYNLVAHDGKYGEWHTWANGVADPIRTKPGQVIEDVVLRLTRPATVRGKVVDESGQPVADRQVRAQAQDKLGNRYYDPAARTNEDGTFEIRFIRPGKHNVQVHPFWLRAEDAPDTGTRVVTLAAREIVEGIELVAPDDEKGRIIKVGDRKIVLPAASGDAVTGAKGAIKGVVVDEKGTPVVGASVLLMNGDLATNATRSACTSGQCFISDGPVGTQTDDQGRFKYTQLLAGKSDIEARLQGHRTAIVRDASTGADELRITLMAPTSYTLTGTISGADTEPVADAEVILVQRWHGATNGSPTIVRTRSTAKGTFTFPDRLKPLDTWGHWSRSLLVRKDGHAIWGRGLDPTGAETEITVHLPPAAEVTGRVINDDGEPVANAEVQAWSVNVTGADWNYSVNYWQIEDLALRARTNEEGDFTIGDMPPGGQITLFVMAPGYAKGRADRIEPGGEDVEIELEREVILRGVAVYENTGEPVKGLQVNTQGVETAAWASTNTDEKGCFELRAIKPEHTNLFAIMDPPVPGTARDWATPAIVFEKLSPGDVKENLKFVLTKGGVIRGKVTDAAGHPLKDINIAFYSAARPRKGAACQACYTAEDGTWAYRFPPGEVYVYIRTNIRDGTWSKSDHTLQLEAGETIDNIDFKLNSEVPEDSPHRAGKTAELSRR